MDGGGGCKKCILSRYVGEISIDPRHEVNIVAIGEATTQEPVQTK